MAPIAIAHVPVRAPLLRAINPRTIPVIPRSTGNTNKDNTERAIAISPIPVLPAFISLSSRVPVPC